MVRIYELTFYSQKIGNIRKTEIQLVNFLYSANNVRIIYICLNYRPQ